jgi:hypothetical protein
VLSDAAGEPGGSRGDSLDGHDFEQARGFIFDKHDHNKDGKLDGAEIGPLPMLTFKFF